MQILPISHSFQVDALNTQFSSTYHAQQFAPYNVSGQTTGQYKNAGTFSYVRIYGAGHEVPAYRVRYYISCTIIEHVTLTAIFWTVWDFGDWPSGCADVYSDHV